MILRRPTGRRPATRESLSLAAGMLADFRASLQQDGVGTDAVDTLRAWESYLLEGGAPPDPVPLNASPSQVEQSLRSFIRNIERMRQTNSDARLHELRSTVSAMVTIVATHAEMIRVARTEIHKLLHDIDDGDGGDGPAFDVARSIRATMRQLDDYADRSRTELHQRLHEHRSAMLDRVRAGDRIVESAEEQEMLFRALCGTANLFGESITIVRFSNLDGVTQAQAAATTLRLTFRRDSDVICRIGSRTSLLLIDTPRKHVFRLLGTARESGTLPEMCEIVFQAESYPTVSGALEGALTMSAGAPGGEATSGDPGAGKPDHP